MKKFAWDVVFCLVIRHTKMVHC